MTPLFKDGGKTDQGRRRNTLLGKKRNQTSHLIIHQAVSTMQCHFTPLINRMKNVIVHKRFQICSFWNWFSISWFWAEKLKQHQRGRMAILNKSSFFLISLERFRMQPGFEEQLLTKCSPTPCITLFALTISLQTGGLIHYDTLRQSSLQNLQLSVFLSAPSPKLEAEHMPLAAEGNRYHRDLSKDCFICAWMGIN